MVVKRLLWHAVLNFGKPDPPHVRRIKNAIGETLAVAELTNLLPEPLPPQTPRKALP